MQPLWQENAAAVARKIFFFFFSHLRDVCNVAVMSNQPTAVCQCDIHSGEKNVVISVRVNTIIDLMVVSQKKKKDNKM